MTTDGRTIRAFISSTFRDMHAERDYLTRFIFPELRSRCQKRGADFIGFDLRWGVTEQETQQEGTLSVCLREIERCRPFFVCLLGDRFGWVPPPDTVPVEAFERIRTNAPEGNDWYALDDTADPPVYRLRRGEHMPADTAERIARLSEAAGLPLAGESITAREIRRGVFEQGYPRTHSFFYLRKSGVERVEGFPAAFVPVFSETDGERRRRLATLKKDVGTAADDGRMMAREYEVAYAGLAIDPALLPSSLSAAEREALADGVIDAADWPSLSDPVRRVVEASGTIALQREGLEALGRAVLDDLWASIEADLGAPVEVLDDDQVERGYHERFVANRMRLFLGRDDLVQRALEYLDRADDHAPLIVTGWPGGGKSALLAACVSHYRALSPQTLVVPFFIGASPGSTALPHMLRSLCETLRRECGIEDAVPEEQDKLRRSLPDFLAKAGATRPVVLVLDALNELDPIDRSHELAWLPFDAPRGIKIILSTLPGEVLDRLRRHAGDAHVLDVPALRQADQRRLVEAYLKERRKKLTEPQLSRLLDKETRPESGLPLYLMVAAEELCLFGAHEAVTTRIERLPATVAELFNQVLARLEHDHGEGLTASIARWLAVSRGGLLEVEILDLLGPDLPAARWTSFYRALEFALRPMEEERERRSSSAARLDFYHDQLRLAVYRRYLAMDSLAAGTSEICRAVHQELAAYFRDLAAENGGSSGWREDRPRALSELPYHLTSAGQWEDLERTLTDLQFVEANAAARLGYSLIDTYDGAVSAIASAGREPSPELQGYRRFVRASMHVLATDPRQTFQQAANLPDAEAPALAARQAWDRGAERRSWLRWTNKPQGRDACRLTIPKQGAFAFSPDGRSIVSAWRRTLRIWDTATGQLLATLDGHDEVIQVCAFSPDGRQVLSAALAGGGAGAFKVWDALSGRCLSTADCKEHGNVAFSSFSSDTRFVAGVSPIRHVVVHDWRSGRLKLELGEEIWGNVAYSPTGDRVAAVKKVWGPSRFDEVLIWRVNHPANRLGSWVQRRFGSYWSLSGRAARGLGSWLTGPLGALRLTRDRAEISGLTFSPDGRRLAIVSAATLRVWDLATRRANFERTECGGAIAYSPDARKLACGSNRHPTIDIIDADDGRTVAVLAGHAGPIVKCAYSPDGHRIASTSSDETLKIWDAPAGTEARLVKVERHSGPVSSCIFSPDGLRIVSSSTDSPALRIWNASTGATESEFGGGLDSVSVCTYSPDGGEILSAGASTGVRQGQVQRWDPETGDCLSKDQHAWPATDCAYSPDGRRFVASFDMGRTNWESMRIYEFAGERHGVRSREERSRTLSACAYGTDGRAVARALGGTDLQAGGDIEIVDPESGENYTTLKGHSADVNACAFSPDGRGFVSASRDGTVKIWDPRTAACIQTFEGHASAVRICRYTPDGRFVASASDDGTIKMWRVGVDRPILALAVATRAIAFGHAGRTLAVGDVSGAMRLLQLMGVDLGPPYRTAVRLYSRTGSVYDEHCTAICDLCSTRFKVPEVVMRVLSSMDAGLAGSRAPAFELPFECWDEPRLLSQCPSCHMPLRFNPFVVDDRDRYRSLTTRSSSGPWRGYGRR